MGTLLHYTPSLEKKNGQGPSAAVLSYLNVDARHRFRVRRLAGVVALTLAPLVVTVAYHLIPPPAPVQRLERLNALERELHAGAALYTRSSKAIVKEGILEPPALQQQYTTLHEAILRTESDPLVQKYARRSRIGQAFLVGVWGAGLVSASYLLSTFYRRRD